MSAKEPAREGRLRDAAQENPVITSYSIHYTKLYDYPALHEANYPPRFNLGLVTTSGSLGLLFAPSLPLILYGIVAQQAEVGPPVSIEDLFLAGILPGLLIVIPSYSIHYTKLYESASATPVSPSSGPPEYVPGRALTRTGFDFVA